MRTPNKSRSRNKNNRRNNSGGGGNVLNRVYDSAGPEGKVRGTPQQVIEKYESLAHDSALSGDRVAMENFQQHAEHYIRLINEAQRQMAERREAQEAERQQQGGGNNRGGDQPRAAAAPADSFDPGAGDQPSMGEPTAVEGEAAPDAGGLVETPETKAEEKRKPRTRKPRPPREPKSDDATQTAAE